MAKLAVPDVVYAKLSGVVHRTGGGKTLLRKGDKYAPDDPLVIERPDLFSADPGDVKSTVAPPRTRECLHCRADFEVSTGRGRPAWHCSDRCRKAREKGFQRALRRLARGEAGDPARLSDSLDAWRKYRDRLNEDIQAMVDLGNRLAQRMPSGGQGRFQDEARLPVKVDAALQGAVRAELERLALLRNDATDRIRGREEAARVEPELTVWPSIVRQAQQRDAAWREDLLTAVGDEGE